MNQKTIIRAVLAIIVAAVGAWQFQGQQAPSKPSNRAPTQQQSAENKPQSKVGDFDYYVVSLSWSPTYCVTHPNDKRQCGGRGFGFVLHGLWPQKSQGGYPADCPTNSKPSAAMVQKTLAFMPSERLIAHEWAKHGSCSGLSGDEYLALSDKAFGSINLPQAFQAPGSSRQLTADQIVAEFVQANPGLSKDSLAVKCSGGEFEELRVCVDTQLKPMSCGKGVRTQCRRDAVQVRAVR
jgi:ribonuclease T2